MAYTQIYSFLFSILVKIANTKQLCIVPPVKLSSSVIDRSSKFLSFENSK